MRKMDWRMAVLFCAALCCMLLAAVFSIEGPGKFWPGKGLWGRGGFLLGSLFYMSGVLGGAVCASREVRMPLFSELLQCLLLSAYAFLAFWREQSFAALLTAAGSAAPFDILPAVWLASGLSVGVGILACRALARVWGD